MGRCGPQWSKNIYISENLYIDFLKKKILKNQSARETVTYVEAFLESVNSNFFKLCFKGVGLGHQKGLQFYIGINRRKKINIRPKKLRLVHFYYDLYVIRFTFC